jgi:hypothetical protein
MTSTTAANFIAIAVAASSAWTYHGAIAADPAEATNAALRLPIEFWHRPRLDHEPWTGNCPTTPPGAGKP